MLFSPLSCSIANSVSSFINLHSKATRYQTVTINIEYTGNSIPTFALMCLDKNRQEVQVPTLSNRSFTKEKRVEVQVGLNGEIQQIWISSGAFSAALKPPFQERYNLFLLPGKKA